MTQANSTASSDPSLPWLVDRWAAPDWLPLANVFSVGDVVIAVGAFVHRARRDGRAADSTPASAHVERISSRAP